MGVKVLGSKQWGQVVGFGSYAYNNAVGGGFGVTKVRRAANAGLAYLKPLNVRGEVALAGSWARPIDGDLRDQSGLEAYWKILVMSNFWTTPGVQYLINPSLNPETGSILLAQIKISAFF